MPVADDPNTRNDLVLSWASWLLWGIPMALGAAAILWPFGRAILLTIAFTWAGTACVVNARRCGRFHCHITGPLYLGLGLLSAMIGLKSLTVDWRLVGVIFALGTAIAYLPEFVGWRYVKRGSHDDAV